MTVTCWLEVFLVKDLVRGLFTAFSIYSVIPVPQTDWDRRSMRFALCFFPLVGVVVGLAVLLWYELCGALEIGEGLFAAGATLLPIAVSGGIHVDGFMDTADAISSHGSRERKLEILKDSHVGAFGVLYLCGYLLLTFGLWQQIARTPEGIPAAVAGYVVSRCLNPISIVTFPQARKDGMVHYLANNASRGAVLGCCVTAAAAVLILCVAFAPLTGIAAAAVTLAAFFLHRRFCIREFGGNTGDLAGFLLMNTELIFLLLAGLLTGLEGAIR